MISAIGPDSAAARKPELEIGLLLTHVNGLNVEDFADKWPNFTRLNGPIEAGTVHIRNALLELANRGNRPVTLKFKRPGAPDTVDVYRRALADNIGEPEPDPLNPLPELVSGDPYALRSAALGSGFRGRLRGPGAHPGWLPPR